MRCVALSTEKRFWTSADESICDSNSLIWENNKEFSIIEVVKLLDEQHETIQRQKYIIDKQETTLADHINSKYKCALCGLVGFIGEQFIKELKR
jgi:hypothetical protein